MKIKLSQAAFACYDASCRPPTSGGTGGSSKRRAGVVYSRPGEDREDFRERLEAEGRARARSGKPVVDPALKREREYTTDAKYMGGYNPHRTAQDAGAMSETAALELVRAKDATGRRILDKGVEVADGQPVGVRANLNVKKTTGVTVQTMHKGTQAQLDKGTGMFGGEAIGYGAAVTLRNVRFSVNQEARAKIYTKEENKFPMASVDGNYVANPGSDRFHGIEVTFNPMKQHLFVDSKGRPVKAAEEVTVVGSKVYVRGKVTFYGPDDMPPPARDLPTDAVPRPWFS